MLPSWTRMAAFTACAASVLSVILFPIGIGVPDDGSGCIMTRMWPNWVVEHESENYRLFRYVDGEDHSTVDPHEREPIIFVPGNGGSYKQARSIGHVMAENKAGQYSLYAVDFKGELCAFSADIFERQQQYLFVNVTATVRKLHGLKPSHRLGCIAHSMGGIIASLNTSNWEYLIALATPFTQPPLMDDSYYKTAYDLLKQPPRIPVVSVMSGIRDFMVPAHHSVNSDFVTSHIHVSDIDPGIECDHLSMVWCNQVVKYIVNELLPRKGIPRSKVLQVPFLKAGSTNQTCAVFPDTDAVNPVTSSVVITNSKDVVTRKNSSYLESVSPQYQKPLSSKKVISQFRFPCSVVSEHFCFPSTSRCHEDTNHKSYLMLPFVSEDDFFVFFLPHIRSNHFHAKSTDLTWFSVLGQMLVHRVTLHSVECPKGGRSYLLKDGNVVDKRGVVLIPDLNHPWELDVFQSTGCVSMLNLSPQWTATLWHYFIKSGGVSSLIPAVCCLILCSRFQPYIWIIFSLSIYISPVTTAVAYVTVGTFLMLSKLTIPQVRISSSKWWPVPILLAVASPLIGPIGSVVGWLYLKLTAGDPQLGAGLLVTLILTLFPWIAGTYVRPVVSCIPDVTIFLAISRSRYNTEQERRSCSLTERCVMGAVILAILQLGSPSLSLHILGLGLLTLTELGNPPFRPQKKVV